MAAVWLVTALICALWLGSWLLQIGLAVLLVVGRLAMLILVWGTALILVATLAIFSRSCLERLMARGAR